MSIQRGEYMHQLDGVRALAIGAVLVSHLMPTDFLPCQLAHLARFGVLLFLTLSGFLITGILLRCRADSVGSNWRGIGAFYCRRALRIFPIFYLSILVLALAGNHAIRQNLWWYLTYTVNMGVIFFDASYRHSGHLWSLCVEEQFYMLWPFIVLFAPRRMLPAATLALVIGSVGYKLLLANILGRMALKMTLFGCMDALGVGALMALAWHSGAPAWLSRSRLVNLGWRVGLPVLIISQACRYTIGKTAFAHPLYMGFSDVAACLAFVPLLAYAASNGQGLLGRFLGWSPITYLGKISYGIYLYHVFIRPMCANALEHLAPGLGERGLALFALCTAAAIGLSALSWHLLESPINNLKRHFPYARPAAPPAQDRPARMAA